MASTAPSARNALERCAGIWFCFWSGRGSPGSMKKAMGLAIVSSPCSRAERFMARQFCDDGFPHCAAPEVSGKDRLILEVLQQNGRISNKDLASVVGLSNSACLERTRRLERAGVILGYGARIAPAYAASRFEVLASVRTLDLPEDIQKGLQCLMEDCDHIVCAYQMAGAFDCGIHFASESPAEWRAFCAQLEIIGVSSERVSFGVVTSRIRM
jgi:DNA-binding Lrp family transcriptional regulator